MITPRRHYCNIHANCDSPVKRVTQLCGPNAQPAAIVTVQMKCLPHMSTHTLTRARQDARRARAAWNASQLFDANPDAKAAGTERYEPGKVPLPRTESPQK